MKFKKNDKIRMVKRYCNAQVGYIGEIRGFYNGYYAVYFRELNRLDYGHTCDGMIPEGGGHYIPEDYMELLMTFPQKLEKFKTERVGFHVDTKEIADELQKVFDKEKLKGATGIVKRAWERYGKTNDLYVSYNVTQEYIGFGTCERSGDNLKEILPITLEELKEYNSHQQLTITITSDGYHRVTAESNGKTAEALCNPTDTFDVAEGAKLAIQRLTAEEPKELPKFSVGDTVEVINGGPNNTPVESKGMRGEVVEKFKGRINVEFGKILSSSSKTDSSFWYRPENLKLASKDELMFHKGDLVEVLKVTGAAPKETEGLQGIVMDDDDVPFVKFPVDINGRDYWAYYESELKLIRRANA